MKALPLFLPFLPALDEWKLADALRDAGTPAKVMRCHSSRQKPEACRVRVDPLETGQEIQIRAFVAGWIAGALAN